MSLYVFYICLHFNIWGTLHLKNRIFANRTGSPEGMKCVLSICVRECEFSKPNSVYILTIRHP